MTDERLTPIQCMEQGAPMTEARQMSPEALTREDCRRLLEAEFPQHIIAGRYSLSTGDFFLKLKEWGLNRKAANWDFKKGESGKKAPVKEVHNTADDPGPAIVDQDVVLQADAPQLKPADLTRKKAAELLAGGTTKQQIKRLYNFKNDASLYLRLQTWGLHERKHGHDWKTDPEEVIRVAQAVLREEEKQDLFAEPGPVPQQPQGNVTTAPDSLKEAYLNDGIFKIQPISDPDLSGHIEDMVGGRAPISETPISKAVAQAVATGEIKIQTTERPTPPPTDPLANFEFELCEPKLRRSRELWIRVTIKKHGRSGGSISFSASAWASFTGHRFNLEVSRKGDVIRLYQTPGGRYMAQSDACYVGAGTLMDKLVERGVKLPVRYILERCGEVWIGRIEADAIGESEAV